VSDESQPQVAPKDEKSSLSLSKVRSGLIARGRRDAALLAVRCDKCGEHRELVFAGCVCANCSDAFDRQWADSMVTDWVLVAFRGPEPPRILGTYTRSSYFSCWWETFHEVEGPISREEVERVVSTDGSWLPLLYVYTKTTYAQVKSYWAKCDPSDSLCIGPMTIDEFVERDRDGCDYPAWPHGREPIRDAVPYVRPALPQEIGHILTAGQTNT